jgi:PTH2 family peptidyl-tRNA hydrolase
MSDKKETKMVIVMRKDLKNKKGEKIHTGKVIAQGAHSALGFVWKNVRGKKISFEMTDAQFNWYTTGQTKITLKVDGEDALLEIFKQAQIDGIFVELITDAGRTEFAEPTITCLALGPDYAEKIDKITGKLSTY